MRHGPRTRGQVDLGLLALPQRRRVALLVPAGRQVAWRSGIQAPPRDAGACGELEPPRLDAPWHLPRAGPAPGLRRLDDVDRVSGAGRDLALASLLYRHVLRRRRLQAADRP